jgi:RecB family exonuclease
MAKKAKEKKVIKLSATRINAFLQCKQRYWYNYVDRLPKPDNPVFKLGLACHESLEFAGLMMKELGIKEFSAKQKEEILKKYDEMSVKEGILEYSDHELGKELVEYRLNNFNIGEKIIGIEDKFGFPGTQDLETSTGVKLIGALDKVVELDEDTILIVDYKTSKFVPDAGKLKHDVQLSMYNLAVRRLYPQYKRVILSLDMLRKGELVYTYRTDEELEEFEEYLDAVHAEMVKLEEKDVKPNLNTLCGWCDYISICPSYQEFLKEDSTGFTDTMSMRDKDLIDEWHDVRIKKKLLEAREAVLNDIMMDKIKIQEHVVASDTEEMVLRQMARTTYNPMEVCKIVPPEDLPGLVSISPTKIKKYADANPSVKHLLDEISETNYTSAFLASKKIKVEKPKKEKKPKTTKKKTTKKD